jgi:hypothetical protein
MSYIELSENTFVKFNRKLFVVKQGVMVPPSLAETKTLRDELREQSNISQSDWRRYNEIDSYYTNLCLAFSSNE